MEATASLIGTDSAVELNAEAAVYLNDAIVIYPSNAELNKAFGLDDAIHNARLNEIGTLFDNGSERFENLTHRLQEFLFACVTLFDLCIKVLKILIVDLHNITSKRINT